MRCRKKANDAMARVLFLWMATCVTGVQGTEEVKSSFHSSQLGPCLESWDPTCWSQEPARLETSLLQEKLLLTAQPLGDARLEPVAHAPAKSLVQVSANLQSSTTKTTTTETQSTLAWYYIAGIGEVHTLPPLPETATTTTTTVQAAETETETAASEPAAYPGQQPLPSTYSSLTAAVPGPSSLVSGLICIIGVGLGVLLGRLIMT